MLFRRTYWISHLKFRNNADDQLTFSKDRFAITFRPLEVIGGEAVDMNACQADLQFEADMKPALAAIFAQISHNCLPEEPAIIAAIAAAKRGVPYQQQRSVMMESMPQHFQDYARSLRERMDGSAACLVGLIRWRNALYGPAKSITSKRSLEWSDDSETWYLMPFVLESSLRAEITLSYDKGRHAELQTMYHAGLEEPIYRELHREAVNLAETTPRGALVLAVAAVEIAIKTTINELDPTSKSELENENAPPALTLLRDRLPTLTARNTLCGVVLPPPSRLLTTFQKAVHARNELVHRGTEPLSRDSLIEKMNAIRDILLLLDYYQGQDWAYEQMTAETIAELGPRKA